MLADAERPRARAARRVPLPAQRGRAAHRRAAAAAPPPRLGELELPPARRRRTGKPTVTYHMNRLQSLRADREFCVTLNRTEAIDPAKIDPHDPVRAPGVHRGRARPRRSATRRSAARDRTHFCGAYWGWGFHEDGVVSALRVAERLGARPRERTARLRGHRPPPPLRGARATSSATASRWPTSTSTSCRGCSAAAARAPPRARALPPRATTSAIRRCRSTTRCARSSRSAPAPRRTARPPAHPACARSALLQPGQLLLLLRPRRARLRAVVAEVTNTPWGERHAYVLRGDGRGAARRAREGAARLAVHGHGPALRVGAPSRARRCRCTSRAARTAGARSTPRSRCTAGAPAPLADGARCASLALIYGHAALALRVPHPGSAAA